VELEAAAQNPEGKFADPIIFSSELEGGSLTPGGIQPPDPFLKGLKSGESVDHIANG
jgi:hypothetical protein